MKDSIFKHFSQKIGVFQYKRVFFNWNSWSLESMYNYSRHQWLRAAADGSGEFVGARMMFLSLLDIPGPKETVLRPQNLSRSHSQPF